MLSMSTHSRRQVSRKQTTNAYLPELRRKEEKYLHPALGTLLWPSPTEYMSSEAVVVRK